MNLNAIRNRLIILDGSVLIGLALGEKQFNELKEAIIQGLVHPITHELAIIEMLYILCRRKSMELARRKYEFLKSSGFIEIIPTTELIEDVGMVKCKRRLAIADCFTISLAIKLDAVAVFAKLEKELKLELTKEPFQCDFFFILEDKFVHKRTLIRSP